MQQLHALGWDMVNISCCDRTCGVVFGMPTHIYEQAKEKGKDRSFYCPNGHVQWFAESEQDRLRKQVESAEAGLNRWRENYDSERKGRIYWQGQAHRKPKTKTNGK